MVDPALLPCAVEILEAGFNDIFVQITPLLLGAITLPLRLPDFSAQPFANIFCLYFFLSQLFHSLGKDFSFLHIKLELIKRCKQKKILSCPKKSSKVNKHLFISCIHKFFTLIDLKAIKQNIDIVSIPFIEIYLHLCASKYKHIISHLQI